MRRTNYSMEEVELGLQTLVRCSGNSAMASRRLKEQGLEVSAACLRQWRTNYHKARYLELVEELVPVVRAQAAQQAAELAEREGDLEHKTIDRLNERLPHMDDKDVINLHRSNATARGINLTHLDKMQTDPDARGAERNSLEQTIAELKRLAPSMFIDGTAEEVPVPALEEKT